METIPKKNPQLHILLIILTVVVGVLISIMAVNYSMSLEGAVASSQSIGTTKSVVVKKSAEEKVTDAVLSTLIETGKAVRIDVDQKTNDALKKIMLGSFGIGGVLPDAYMYFCRPNGGGTGSLIQTQVNMGSSVVTETSTCVQVLI